MAEIGINLSHAQLRNKLIDYIKTQYMGENPLLLSATENLLQKEGTLYPGSIH